MDLANYKEQLKLGGKPTSMRMRIQTTSLGKNSRIASELIMCPKAPCL